MMIYTARLKIRLFKFSDWVTYQRIALDFQASEYRYYDHALTDSRNVQAAARYAASTGLWFSVCLGEEMIGYVCFHEENGLMDVGYRFHSSVHGNGFAYESVSALLELLASVGIRRFSAGTALDNTPSVRLLERLGFVMTGTEEICFYDGHPFTGGRFRLDME